jgi:hypothetical protein
MWKIMGKVSSTFILWVNRLYPALKKQFLNFLMSYGKFPENDFEKISPNFILFSQSRLSINSKLAE